MIFACCLYSCLRLLALLLVAAPCSHCDEEFDIIVVGSGLVGSAVSSRLAELLPTKKILVLEGGHEGQRPRGHASPSFWNETIRRHQLWPGQWNGWTAYDVPGTYGIYSGSSITLNSYIVGEGDSWSESLSGWIYCPKINGGGGTVNGALTQRVQEGMFKGHADFGLAPWPADWNATSMEPYYQEVEKLFSLTATPSADGKHYLDESGPAQLREALATPAPCSKSIDVAGSPPACAAYPEGFREEKDVRKPLNGVMGHPSVTASGGIRQSTATVLQSRALSRDNYELRTRSEVTKIFHKDGLASAVQYEQSGSNKTARLASGGLLLLSAGAIQTPRLLLSNSIGDPARIGRNLSDHGMTRQVFRKAGWNVTAFEYPPSESLRASYITNQTGPLAQYGPLWVAFVRDPTTPGMPDDFDVEVFINPSSVQNEIVVWYVLMRPTCSRGDVRWNGTTGTINVDGWNMYFACERDIQTMQYARDVVKSRMSALGATCVHMNGDVCNSINVNGTKTLRTNTYAINHHAGTCPLDKCVDAKTLRLHGSKNIAVADASILPGQVWGHPAMTLEALALRAADLLASSLQTDISTKTSAKLSEPFVV